MKKCLLIAIVIAVVIVVAGLFAEDFTYVGADKCKICHKTEKQGQQFPIWEGTKHAKTTEALTTEEATLT